jgi:HSP20 family molecular chaperone IbpA
MKPHRLGESSIAARFRRRASENPPRSPRECVVLADPTDCLLDAYDCVAQRAYENFLAFGPRPGGELEDWLNAERQLLLNFPIDIEETPDFIYALASVPGATAARISIGIESRWIVIVVRQPRKQARMALAAKRESADSEASKSDQSRRESKADQPPTPDHLLEDRRAKSVCVLGLPSSVDGTRSIAVLSDGVLGIRMAKLHPGS